MASGPSDEVMTTNERRTPDLADLSDLDADADALFDVLSDARRRFVVARLHENGEPMSLADVADELAVWERDEPLDRIPADEVASVYMSLYHVHVPKMADAGVVEYSQQRDAVALAEHGDEIQALVALPSVA